jgi:hypothetical protein
VPAQAGTPKGTGSDADSSRRVSREHAAASAKREAPAETGREGKARGAHAPVPFHSQATLYEQPQSQSVQSSTSRPGICWKSHVLAVMTVHW